MYYFKVTDDRVAWHTTLAGWGCCMMLFFASTASAQSPPYGAPITLDQAKTIGNAAESEAIKNNRHVVIHIVDSGGAPVYLLRMDGSNRSSTRIAEGKALTALDFRQPSQNLENTLAQSTRILALDGIMPAGGGFPIVYEGEVIGAIGVSGATSPEDEQIAQAGIDALIEKED